MPDAIDEQGDVDVWFLRSFANTLRRSATEGRRRGRVLGPECAELQVPIFERIADRLTGLVAREYYCEQCEGFRRVRDAYPDIVCVICARIICTFRPAGLHPVEDSHV